MLSYAEVDAVLRLTGSLILCVRYLDDLVRSSRINFFILGAFRWPHSVMARSHTSHSFVAVSSHGPIFAIVFLPDEWLIHHPDRHLGAQHTSSSDQAVQFSHHPLPPLAQRNTSTDFFL